MRRNFYLCLVAISVLFSSQLASAKNTVTLATTQWAPYVQNDPYYKGYAYNIVESAFRQAGYDVTIKFMPWDEAVAAVEAGEIDGIFPEYFSAKNTQSVVYSEPFSGGPIGLYKRVGSKIKFPVREPEKNQDKVFAQLKKYKFGVVKGYTNVPAFDKNEVLKKVVVNNDKDNLLQLYNDDVQLIIIDKYTAQYIIQHQLGPRYARALTFMEPAIGYKNFYLGISKNVANSYKLLNDFNHGLDAIKSNGKMAKILDKDAYYTGRLIA